MKKATILGTIVAAALLTAAPFSLQWSQKTVTLSLDPNDLKGRADCADTFPSAELLVPPWFDC
jgi:hypothetical protein